MGLVILIVMAILVAAAASRRDQPFAFAAIIGVITFLLTPLFSFGDAPLGAVLGFMSAARVGVTWVIVFAALVFVVYGGIGALMCWYVRTYEETRPVRLVVAAIFGAAISGMAYMGIRMVMRQMTVGLGPLFISLATGAAVGAVVAFAMTHERPAGSSFFESRDGGTITAALAGALATVVALSLTTILVGVLAHRPPAPFGMRLLVQNLVLGGLLGAGLTVPLRATDAGRLARSLIGGAIGCLVFAALFRSASDVPLAGLLAGAAGGAVLPAQPFEAAVPQPDLSDASDLSDTSDSF